MRSGFQATRSIAATEQSRRAKVTSESATPYFESFFAESAQSLCVKAARDDPLLLRPHKAFAS